MSVTALSARTGRHTSHPAGRTGTVLRRATTTAPAPPPSLTVTLAIPLTDEGMTPQAHRLLDALRELVEKGQGAVTVASSADPTQRLDVPAGLWPDTDDLPPAAPVAADPAEVRLLTASRQVLVGGEPLPMTRLEFDLLLFLADNPRRVFTRMQLLTAVWGYEHTGERTVDVHVRRLRVKMGVHIPLITTVYGVGYRLADDARIVVAAN